MKVGDMVLVSLAMPSLPPGAHPQKRTGIVMKIWDWHTSSHTGEPIKSQDAEVWVDGLFVECDGDQLEVISESR